MMTEQRKGEIALLIFEMRIMEDGFTFDQNTRRHIGNTAAKIGISLDEGLQFMEEMMTKLLSKNFKSKVTDGTTSAAPRGKRS